MSSRLSRRSMASYIANGLIEGRDTKQLFLQLAGYLVDSRRTKELSLIVRDIEYNLSEKGIVQGEVISAFELTAETVKALETLVKDKTNASQVSLSTLVNPSVLGGVKITIPGHELDQTAAHQLTVLKTRFKKA